MDLDKFFEQFNISEFEYHKALIIQNTQYILHYILMSETAAIILSDSKKISFALFLLNFFISKSENEENIEIYLALIRLYASKEICYNYNALFSSTLRSLFNLLNKFSRNEEGLELFSNIANNYIDENLFNNSKAYAIYFAYQLRSYHVVNKILISYFIELKSDNYKEAQDFNMMNFYKGIIFLSQEASIYFSCTFKVLPPTNIYTNFHIESFRRLILLSYLIDPVYRPNITNIINNHKSLLHIKPVESYGEFNKLMLNKATNYKEVERYIKDHTAKFKADKTNGLVKLCLKEFALGKIQQVLKFYKRIKLEKLCCIVEIEELVLVQYLKKFTYNNRLNVRLDDVDNILEVFENEFDDKKPIQELKNTYTQKELINVSFKKAETIEKSKIKAENMQMRSMLLETLQQGEGMIN